MPYHHPCVANGRACASLAFKKDSEINLQNAEGAKSTDKESLTEQHNPR